MKGIYKQINLNYGIVTDENDTEYFIFKNYRNNAFSGDFVEIKITKEAEENKKPEAKIIEIISRTKEPLVGIFIKNKNNNYGFVKINDTFYGKDIFISKENQNLAKNNDVVLVKII
ncbi:hypothetical protein KAZ01_02790 [Candidatus Gracilibacteria bacterium]|nr:hypothetical protein [Candidatus Gracilibacteria bacterium]